MALIETIYGPMEESLIIKGKKTGGYENANEISEWVEYWLEGILIHRSASVRLKKGITVGLKLYQAE